MSESTAMVVVTPEEQAYLDSLGSEQGPAANGPPKLVINTKSKDTNGVKRQIGAWHIEGTDKYCDEPVTLRPVRYANKLIRYVEDANGGWQFAGESVYFKDYREEIPDTLGGLALGRKFGKKFSQDEKDATKKLADAYCDVFGFVTFGTDEPVPIMYRTRGGRLKGVIDAFGAVPKDKRYSQFNYSLEAFQDTDEKTKKVNDYWSVNVTPDLSQVLPTLPLLSYDAAVMDYIRDTNASVMELHRKNFKGTSTTAANDTTATVVSATVLPPIGSEFNEELPF